MDDIAVLHERIRAQPFATFAVNFDECIAFAYAPVVLDTGPAPFGRLRFHLARSNPAAAMAGRSVHVSFLGVHTYISPDWYRSHDMVPTWNYIAIEARGIARALDEAGLRNLLDDLSTDAEAKLAPKQPWTSGKVSADRMTMLLRAISGFEVVLEGLDGKFKLSQEKSDSDFDGALAGLLARDDAAGRFVAAEMQKARKR